MLKSKYILILIIPTVILLGLSVWWSYKTRNFEVENIVATDNPKIEEVKPETILFVGDIMLDRKVELLMKKNGFDYPFEKISQFLNESDGVFGNLEGPISKNPENYSLVAMEFAFDAKVIEPLASANFKVLSLANNHTFNMGAAGLQETKKLLENARIDWVGDSWICSEKTVIKNDLVFLAFNKTFNGCQDQNLTEIVKSTKASNPDKFLIIAMHWGEEYKLKSSPAQQELAHKIIDAGADLIVGSHPHVVEEIENYKDKLIFYSLGNFIFDQYFSQDVQEGLVVVLEIYPTKFVYKLHPIENNLSQPCLMDEQKVKIFLEKFGLGNTIEINKENKVCFRQDCFFVEMATTPEEWSRGLMNRENLDENRGMLFIFDQEGIYSFWMKNTLIPLDIIWLNQNKEVVFIEKNAQPCKKEICESINPGQKAKYVLEINKGLVDKMGLKTGDYLIF